MVTKQQQYDNNYYSLLQKGYSPNDANDLALKTSESYKEPVEVKGKKSFGYSMNPSSSGNILDVLFGYAGADTEEINGGSTLQYSGWDNIPSKEFSGDINHFSYDVANGVANDLEQKWQNFNTTAKDFYTIEKDGITELRGKVKVPDTKIGKEFIESYNKGDFGVSIEYKGIEGDEFIEDWEITGYTFDTDPSYNTKKPKTL